MTDQYFKCKKMVKNTVLYIRFIAVILLSTVGGSLFAQVEGIIIEKYYIAGPPDTFSFAGNRPLEEGSVTYRVYLDLEQGARLIKIFGDQYRPVNISSTSPFFNHEDYGYPFGFQIKETQLDRNTLALDSWITLGLATRSHWGILKENDPDGSMERIKNNQEPGVLASTHPDTGIPLGESDGFVPKSGNYTFGHGGIIDISSQEDTNSIFSVYRDTNFFSTSFFLQDGSLNGITGADNNNHVLIAQLTTKGEITFRINAEVKNGAGEIFRIFGKDTLIDASNNEKYSSWLSYPVIRNEGCMDPYYVQYDPKAEEDDGTWCKDLIVFGCLDTAACNYTATANYHLPELCCYDSKCALDLGVLCPGTVYGCMDPLAVNYNPLANTTSNQDNCCYISGCMDNRYLEYNPNACHHDSTGCKILIINGCMDKNACNYNPFATRNSGCIYNDCDKKSFEWKSNAFELKLYPNPAGEESVLMVIADGENIMRIEIWDTFGRRKFNSGKQVFSGEHHQRIDLSAFENGIYIIRMFINNEIVVKRLVKI